MLDQRHQNERGAAPTVGGHRKGRVPREVRMQQILDIAEELFLTKGYDHASIEDICRLADISRPIVYSQVGNKAAIYLACVRRARRTLEQGLAAAATSSTDPQDQLAGAADAYLRILEEDPRRWELLYGKTGVIGELSDQVASERQRTVQTIAALLQSYAPDAEPDWLQACAYLISGAGEQLGRWWLANRHIPRRAAAQFYADFAWTGARDLARMTAAAN